MIVYSKNMCTLAGRGFELQECSIVVRANRMNVLGGYALLEEVFVPSGKASFDPH